MHTAPGTQVLNQLRRKWNWLGHTLRKGDASKHYSGHHKATEVEEGQGKEISTKRCGQQVSSTAGGIRRWQSWMIETRGLWPLFHWEWQGINSSYKNCIASCSDCRLLHVLNSWFLEMLQTLNGYEMNTDRCQLCHRPVESSLQLLLALVHLSLQLFQLWTFLVQLFTQVCQLCLETSSYLLQLLSRLTTMTTTTPSQLRAECQSARMSKITNDGITWSGTGCFIAVK